MIEWFTRNHVAANLLMMIIVVAGLIALSDVREEMVPEFELDRISISVAYLGAAPEEVESAVAVRVEEAIQGLDGIKEITSTSSEGMATILVELELEADQRRVVDEVKSSVDAITTFPVETEQPIIRELTARNQVVEVAVSGPVAESVLKEHAERVRDDLSAMPEISQVDVVSARPYEISIEVSERALRRHGLTFDDVADAVRRSSLDLPGGSVRTDGGEILLRTLGQAYRGAEYERLGLLTRADGTRLELSDVARVVDGFAETDQFARFDRDPTVLVSVFRTGDQGAPEISRAVNRYVEAARATLPAGISLTVWRDQGEALAARLSLMLRNGATGFLLVFVMLALFLDLRLAFWVSLGIPISFLGAIILMPPLDLSINIMSLFAFILVLGVVVDDAIIVGENIFRHQERHGHMTKGAVDGAREISQPVVFAVLTTVAAFMPLMFVPGMMGKAFIVMPLIVISCLVFSLIESLWILPAHLSHARSGAPRVSAWSRFQGLFVGGLAWFIRRVYRPSLVRCLRWRYLTAAVAMSTLILTVGMVASGWVTFHFFPSVEADYMAATVTMPQGTPVTVTSEAVRQLEAGAARLRRTLEETTGIDNIRHVFASVGDQPTASQNSTAAGGTVSAAHLGEVTVELAPSQQRTLSSEDLGNLWRETTGPISSATEVNFNSSMMSPGSDLDIMFAGSDIDRLRGAADEVKAELQAYVGVYDITDSFRRGKQEVRLGIRPAAETLGLTLRDLGRQVRQAFYGEEAQRIQRGRDDVRVMVRYPSEERRSLGDLDNMWIRTPDGGAVPFRQVALTEPGRGFAAIRRVDRSRAVNVTAAINAGVTSSGALVADLESTILPAVLARYPGVSYTFGGMQREQQDAVGGLQTGFSMALIGIFALLAIPLKSYLQPLIIMSAIPFGLVGAVWGHIVLGLDVTLMSMFGLVALSGVVVNDSLVMVLFINRHREEHADLTAAVREAGATRFRPILLTSLTTFVGLVPLMFDESFEAAFMVPMAVSLAFGVLFATFITLILVPTSYLILHDVQHLARLLFRWDSAAGVAQEAR